METKEPIWKQILYYIPRLITAFIGALSMKDEGLSLKKILATYSTYLAGHFTELWLAPNNVIVLVLMWLIYAGILVGIYSIADISKAINSYKGDKKDDATV